MKNIKNPTSAHDDIELLLVNHLAKSMNMDPSHIDREKSFLEYGLSSISAMMLSGELSDYLNKEISPMVFIEYDTIASLTHHIGNLLIALPHTPILLSEKVFTNPNSNNKAHNLIHEISHFNTLRDTIINAGGNSLYFNVAETMEKQCHESGHTFINYSAYNYLGFAKYPMIEHAAIAAIKKYGTSVSASRMAGGDSLLHRSLETAISQFIGTEDCVVFNSGHATNVTTIGHIMNAKDLILCDELSHNSIWQGARLSQALVIKFKHNDPHDLERLLQQHSHEYDKVMIIIEGLYSMDGDIPNLPQFIALKKQYSCLLYIDEAHSLGVLGATGRGIMELFDVNPSDVDFCMGTLGKALASIGGYIAGKKELIDYLKYTTPGFVYSIGLTPSQTASALTAIEQLKEHPELPVMLRNKSQQLISILKNAGIQCGNVVDTPIIPLIVGSSARAIELCRLLRTKGIFAQAIIYPAVEDNAARVRLFLSVTHSDTVLKHSAEIIINCFQQLTKSVI